MDWVDVILDSEIFVAGLAISIAALLVTRWRYSSQTLKADNNITAFYGSVIGTVYAVVLAFQLANVWQIYRTAQLNADEEANNLASFFQIAQSLPPVSRLRASTLTRQYAHLMVDREWEEMRHGRITTESKRLVDDLWRTVNTAQVSTGAEQVALDHMITELSGMVQHRQERELEMRNGIPGILWIVLIVGGTITVGFACSFGVDSFRRHMFQTLLLTSAICLVLIAIADIDRPYQGGVRVSSEPFQFLLDTLDRAAV